jgi:mRNA interferase MazF
MGMVTERFDVFLVMLDPTVGSEIQKRLAPVGFPDAKSETRETRPCLIISPDEMNSHLATIIVAPMTTSGKQYPSRIPVNFEGKDGFIALDHIRSVSKNRLVRQLGTITPAEQKAVLAALLEMFAEE